METLIEVSFRESDFKGKNLDRLIELLNVLVRCKMIPACSIHAHHISASMPGHMYDWIMACIANPKK
jgi:hypothetical protein